MTTQLTNNEIIKEFYRKTKLIQKNDVKTIWEATHIYNGDVVVAKVQPISENASQRTVLHEGKFLQSCQGSPGIPFLVWCGKDEIQKESILIEQKLGKTLNQILSMSQTQSLSLKSVCMIGIQLIKMINCYHEKGYIHRNINIDTVQFGIGSRCDKLYFNDLIDSRSFYKKNTLQHIDRKTSLKIKKASQFTSYDVLDGVQPSRKDDLESIVLLLIYLFNGSLPWTQAWRLPQSKKNDNKSEIHPQVVKSNKKIPKQYEFDEKVTKLFKDPSLVQGWRIDKRITATREIMQHFSPSQLCRGLPRELLQIYLDVKELEFTQKPNYQRYCQKLNSIMIKNDWQNDSLFDWMTHKSISKPLSQGGLSIKHLQWLLPNTKTKLVQFENELYTLQVYEKMAPYIEIDKLGGL